MVKVLFGLFALGFTFFLLLLRFTHEKLIVWAYALNSLIRVRKRYENMPVPTLRIHTAK